MERPRWLDEYWKLARTTSEFFRPPHAPMLRRRRRTVATAPAATSGDADVDWLNAAPERSASILEKLAAPPPDPQPQPPSTDTGVVWPRNETELRQALQAFGQEDYVGLLHPKTDIEVSQTISVSNPNNNGMMWGVNGQGARLHWVGDGGKDMLVYEALPNSVQTMLFVERMNFYGRGYDHEPAGACLKIHAPFGDPGAIYKFTLRDIVTSWATYGIHLQGAVFEGMLENCHGENHSSHGLFLEHLWTNPVSIISNIFDVHPNFSRNYGAGIRSTYSHNIVGGSWVLNALGGVSSDEGLRGVTLSNGENTGESVIAISTGGYGSTVSASEGSTNGATVARRYEGGQWVDKGKPQLYLLDGDVDWTRSHVSYYGDGTNQAEVRVSKQNSPPGTQQEAEDAYRGANAEGRKK